MRYEKTAKRLVDAMNAKGITAQELAERSGVGKSAISHYVNGNNEPRSRNAGKMAYVLDVNPLWLMGFDIDVIEETDVNIKINNVMHKMNKQQLERLLLYAKFLMSEMGGDE